MKSTNRMIAVMNMDTSTANRPVRPTFSAITILVCGLFAAFSLPAGATDMPPTALTTNCTTSKCGVYLDLSGNASANLAGGDIFSYQPSWQSTNARFVEDAAFSAQNGAQATVDAVAFATIGALKSSLVTEAMGGVTNLPHAGAYAHSTIGFQDRLTFTGAPAGTLATMTGRLSVSGSLGVNSNNQGSAGALAQVNAAGVSGFITHQISIDSSTASTGSLPPYITFEAAVRFGQPDFTLIFLSLRTSSTSSALSGSNPQWAASSADFFSSLEWDGIVSVRDSSGNLLTDWSVTSASGFDYTRSYDAQIAAVPEPEIYAMMGLGLSLVGFATRRRKLQTT